MLSCSPDKKSSKALKIEVKFRQIPRMSRHFSESPQFLDMTSFSRIAEFVPPPVTSCVFLIKKHRKPWFVNRQNSLNMTSFPCHFLWRHVFLIQNRKSGPTIWSKISTLTKAWNVTSFPIIARIFVANYANSMVNKAIFRDSNFRALFYSSATLFLVKGLGLAILR